MALRELNLTMNGFVICPVLSSPTVFWANAALTPKMAAGYRSLRIDCGAVGYAASFSRLHAKHG
jgi:hypothetical protein